MTRQCIEQEYSIDNISCTMCGQCEEIYYIDTEEEYENTGG